MKSYEKMVEVNRIRSERMENTAIEVMRKKYESQNLRKTRYEGNTIGGRRLGTALGEHKNKGARCDIGTGGGCRRSLCKRLRQQHLGDGIRNLPPIRTFLASSLHVARDLRQFSQYMV